MYRQKRLIPLIILLGLFVGCAQNNPPEVTVLQTGSTVLDAATRLQRGITQLTDNKTLPVATAQKLTGYVQQVYDKSGPLGDAVQSYKSITDLNLRKQKASDIVQMIADINSPLSQILKESIPEGALKELATLVSNVVATVAQVQATIAQSLAK